MSTEILERAAAATRAVLANVSTDQLSDPTPCASWKVSDLVNHIVGGQYYFAASMGEQPVEGEAPDFSAGDFRTAFDQGSASAIAAFGADGALDKVVKLPFGDMPGMMFLGIAALDTFTHGWDLAKATGQSTDLDPELAAQLLPMARMGIQPSFRGPEGKAPFGAEQAAPAGASAADELAAFLGRSV